MLRTQVLFKQVKAGADDHGAHYLLFLTHHLLASSKQSDLKTWAKDMACCGLAKRGYPGVVLFLAEGPDSSQRLDRVAKNIKSLRWASQDFRPIQPLSTSNLEALRDTLQLEEGKTARPVGFVTFVDSMKEVSALLSKADASCSRSSNNVKEETWAALWRREMKP
ncbi:unnamed protein product [Jaminaea pallidilutea]